MRVGMKLLPVVLAVLVGFALVYTPLFLVQHRETGAQSVSTTMSGQNGGQENMSPGTTSTANQTSELQPVSTSTAMQLEGTLAGPLFVTAAGVAAGLVAYVLIRKGTALRSTNL